MIKTVEKEEIAKQYEYMKRVKEKVNGLKYCIDTMGCKLNENDSEKIAGMLTKMGYTETKQWEEANLVVFNTCCIRENAEERVFGKLGELKRLKAQNHMIICFAGCMSQEPHVIEKIKKSYSQVDIIFGTHNLYKFPEMLYQELENHHKVFDVWNIDGEIFEGLPIKRGEGTSASVTIMNGCNNFCSYCIVPYTRGRERSRKPEDILKEIADLAQEGYNEIMLLGQNVNSYNGGEGYGFAKLLREIDKIDGIHIVRFMSPHPKDFTDDVIEAIRDCESVCKVIHLPLQSGSSSVLKAMNRGYTKEQYLTLVAKMRKQIPNVAFTTDIIVGFPGETEEDFEDTLDVVRKVKFEQVFMFIYSVRKGTRAEKMPNHIPEEVKSERFSRLKTLADGITEEENLKYIGTIQDVLVEGESKNNKEMLSGRTRTNKVVIFAGDKTLIGKEVKIKIVSEHVWFLKGEVIEERAVNVKSQPKRKPDPYRKRGCDFLINVNYRGKNYEIEEGTTAYEFIKFGLKLDMQGVMACKIANEVKSLDDATLKRDCSFDIIDYTSADGSRIYVRGLTFIAIKAFSEVYPEMKIKVEYALGHSLYCEEVNGAEITEEMLQKVEARMREIVKENIRFEKKILSVEEAKVMYEKSGRDDKVGIIGNRMKSHVSVYACGDTMNYFYGVMPMSTGCLQYFELLTYEKGFILVYPRRSNPTVVPQIKTTQKLYTTFKDYDNLHKILNVSNVSELNKWIQSGKIADLIRISEALHEKKIANIADMIANDREKRIVLIAGPSSSGKTTFAQRLGIQLRVNGIETVTLSMDNYFVNRVDTPKDENGNYDFECLEAIDVKLFNEQLTALLNGEEVMLPTFDFTDGMRKYNGEKVQLHENQVLVIEGIHGLNEKLTASIPRSKKFKIYISALTALNIDDYNRISTTDSRILRRMLRDSKYRSHSATATLKMWPSVRRGEEKYIFPYQEDADAMFNSSLVYEIAILKTYVEPLLASVDRNEPEFSEAKRLYEFLGYFLPIEKDDIPINSIIREFIGGGCFYR